MKSTPEMRARILELMTDPQDDYDRAVECVLVDLGELIATQAVLVTALRTIAAMDPEGIRADDLGRASRIAAESLRVLVSGSTEGDNG